ncbi:MAG: hypothetical protein LBR26_09075 [Prevotella sp.]|nr:hypothetical protein [Prevotella sp.]
MEYILQPLSGIAVRPRLKAFHIPAQYNILGKMNIPGNYVPKGQYINDNQ